MFFLASAGKYSQYPTNQARSVYFLQWKFLYDCVSLLSSLFILFFGFLFCLFIFIDVTLFYVIILYFSRFVC